jgi:hypothetical protein
MNAISPWTNAFLPVYSSLDAKFPWEHELGTFLPLFVMHESSLQMQASAFQTYKEHYNMLKLRHRQAR